MEVGSKEASSMWNPPWVWYPQEDKVMRRFRRYLRRFWPLGLFILLVAGLLSSLNSLN